VGEEKRSSREGGAVDGLDKEVKGLRQESERVRDLD
jgi:hypothetical protein